MSALVRNLLASNPSLRIYCCYAGILTLKMLAMPLLTIRQRHRNNAFLTEEDAQFLKGKVSRINEHVERTRRAHLNDMENIYLFLIVAFAYVWTEPEPHFANLLFLTFTACRFVHTLVYAVIVVPQPARGLAWLIGYVITGFMAVKTIATFGSF